MALPILVQEAESPNFSPAGHAGLTVFLGFLDSDRRKLNSFGTMSLRRILVYRWHDYMSIDLLLRKAGLRQSPA